MKRIFFIVLFLNTFYSFSQNCSYSYQGIVLDEHNLTPVVQAKITFKELNKSVLTDDNGYFLVDSLCAGVYNVHYFHHVGCEPIKKKIQLTNSLVDTIFLEHHFDNSEQATNLNSIIIVPRAKQEYLPARTAPFSSSLQLLDIKIESGKNWADLLKTIPGVTSLSSGSNIQKPAIHGMYGNRVLTLVDETRLEGQQWGLEHAPEINPFTYKQARVIKGADAVAYGSDAVGGVIITELEHYTSKPFRGEVDFGYGSNGNQFFGNLLLEGSTEIKEKRLNWFAQGAFKKGGTMRSPNYYLANTGMEEINTTYALSYQSEKWKTHLAYTFHQGKNGIFSGSHFDNLGELNQAFMASEPLVLGKFTYKLEEPQLITKHNLAVWNNTFYLKNNQNIDVNYAFQLNNRSELHHHDEEEHGAEIDGSSLKLMTQNVTVNYNHVSFENKLVGKLGINYWNQHNQIQGEYLIPEYLKNALGLYLIEKWNFKTKHRLTGGIRYDFTHIQASKIENLDFTNRTNQYNNLSGTLTYSYLYNHHWNLSASIGNTWRSPAINELFSNGIHDAIYDIGNANLKLEQAVFANVGTNYSSRKFNFQVDIYHYHFFNYINYHTSETLVETDHGVFPTYIYDQTKASYSGMDLYISYKFLDWLTLSVKGSTVRAFDLVSKQHLANIPADRITPTLDFEKKYRKNDYANTWHIINFRISTPLVNRQYKAPIEYGFVKSPSKYALLNLAAIYTYFHEKGSVSFSANVDNVMNTNYRDYMNRYRYFVNEIGRSVYFKVNIGF